MFPTDRLDEIQANPADFRLLERCPLTRMEMPVTLNEAHGDEVPAVLMDLETTGLDPAECDIIELGMVSFHYSPAMGRIQRVNAVTSMFEDPGYPIPDNIQGITGITTEMVSGHALDFDSVAEWFSHDPLVIAHNALFDRRFFERRFPELSNLRWGCSKNDPDWTVLGYESDKLEYLVLKNGAFYEGHRAHIDCLATIWLIAQHESIMGKIHNRSEAEDVVIWATGAPFEVKDDLKKRGYRWNNGDNGHPKAWYCTIEENALPDETEFLSRLFPGGDQRATVFRKTARERFA